MNANQHSSHEEAQQIAKCYSTLIANLLKLAHQGLLLQVPFLWENAGSYE
jgi:hypothetical protein